MQSIDLCNHIFRLVVALARDLQLEFYPYYSEFVHNLIELLHTKDTDVLDWTFTCLAYLSKFLWRYLVKDVRIVFTDLLPLLHDSRPDYINNFAAESFAFVARKVKDKRAFLLLVLKTLKKNPEVSTYFMLFLYTFLRCKHTS
jgi:U3 small nucleolar RNA-associated protein 20